MQCHLNEKHISEVPKILTDHPSVNTQAIQLFELFYVTHPLVINLQCCLTKYFDIHSPSIAEYKNEDIPKIHLTVEEPPWDSSTEEYSE